LTIARRRYDILYVTSSSRLLQGCYRRKSASPKVKGKMEDDAAELNDE